MTGIYFNTKLAEQLGIDAAPTSVEEFEADMQTAKDAGILPMMTYAKDGGTSFVFQALMANNSSAEDVQNWIFAEIWYLRQSGGAGRCVHLAGLE